jgi:hypothetical protein
MSSNVPDLPPGMGWPFVDATTGEFQSTAVNDALSATIDAGIDGSAQRLNLRPDPILQYSARNIVMASPPTVTEGASATITAQVINARTDTRIRSLNGVDVLSSDGNWIQARGPRKTDGSFDAGFPDYWFSREFMVDCAAIEFRLLGLANKYVLTVDGERHSATNGTLANTSASRYLKFDFGARKADGTARRMQLSVQQGQLREINLAATDTLFAVQARPAPKLAVLGDSYGTGFATRALVSIHDGYVQHLARLLGLVPVNQNCASSTGFIATNGATAGTYASRVADIIALAPEVVIVQGSINDFASSASAVGAAAASVYSTISAALPDSILIATGIVDARVQSQQGTDAAQNAAIQAAAEANGFTYIDTLGWVTGNGYAGATTGGGNSDVYTHTDQTHYVTRGGLYIAARLAGAIRAVVPQLA